MDGEQSVFSHPEYLQAQFKYNKQHEREIPIASVWGTDENKLRDVYLFANSLPTNQFEHQDRYHTQHWRNNRSAKDGSSHAGLLLAVAEEALQFGEGFLRL